MVCISFKVVEFKKRVRRFSDWDLLAETDGCETEGAMKIIKLHLGFAAKLNVFSSVALPWPPTPCAIKRPVGRRLRAAQNVFAALW